MLHVPTHEEFVRMPVVPLVYALWILDAMIVGYVTVFFVLNVRFVFTSYRRIRYELLAEIVRPALSSEHDAFLPLVSLLVPAYNEEVTIVESLKSQLHLRYPAYEIIICNDGSKDRTIEVLLEAFRFDPIAFERTGAIETARVRKMWECRSKLPGGVRRMVLIDKENGGKADALNAAANVAEGAFVTSMDADSLLVPDALLLAVRKVLEAPTDIIAVGVQVGLTNGSVVKNGKVEQLRLPTSLIGKFQIVEYMRSFGKGRTALSEDNAVLILSGVFALIKRTALFEVGGFSRVTFDRKSASNTVRKERTPSAKTWKSSYVFTDGSSTNEYVAESSAFLLPLPGPKRPRTIAISASSAQGGIVDYGKSSSTIAPSCFVLSIGKLDFSRCLIKSFSRRSRPPSNALATCSSFLPRFSERSRPPPCLRFSVWRWP